MAGFTSLLSTIIALLVAGALGEMIQYCGTQPYYPSAYTCYSGFLCPILTGEPTLKCSSACYLPEAYECTSGTLSLHPVQKGSFSLRTVQAGIPSLNNLPVSACGQHFGIGGGSCTYCPSFLNPSGCAGFTNTTIFANVGSLDVEVPGGQQTYLSPDGSIGFTQAHSISVPTGAVVGDFSAYDQGGYFTPTPSPSGWLACPNPSTSPSTGPPSYTLYAALINGAVPSGAKGRNCVPLKLKTVDVSQGTIGAWQYI